MTTIACDGKTISGDGLITGNGAIHDDQCQKVFHLRDGSVVGMSGEPFLHQSALNFLNGDAGELDLGTNFEALILKPDGKLFCMDGMGRTYPQSIPSATGSGFQFALAVMKMGRTAKEAVELAEQLDPSTGGAITTLSPQQAPSYD